MAQRTAERLIGREALSDDGERIGEVVDIYVDDGTGQPEWLAVRTGWFGDRVSFVPLAGVKESGAGVAVPWSAEHVKAATHAESDRVLLEEEEASLYRHYGLPYPQAPSRVDRGTDHAMTRSEEELRVEKVAREAGRVRLRKYVVTEPVQTKVTVAREQAIVEREAITEANADAAMAGPEISEAEYEVVLREEEVVAEKRVVPKERVRLSKEVTTDERRVEAELAKEQIEVEQVPIDRTRDPKRR